MKLPIQYHPEIYLGPSIEHEKLDTLKAKINKHPKHSGFHIIALASNPREQLDIFNVSELLWSYYKKHPIYAVGIAADYEEALLLVERMVNECLNQRGDVLLKEFLQCGQSF